MSVATLQNWSCYNYGAYATTSSAGIELSYENQLYQVNNAGCGSIGIWVDAGVAQNVAMRTIVESSSNAGLIIGGAGAGTDNTPVFICYWCNFALANSNPFSTTSVVQNRGGVLELIGGRIIPYNGNEGSNTNTGISGYLAQTNAGSIFRASNVIFDESFAGGASNNNGAILCTATCYNMISNSNLLSQSSGFDYTDTAASVFYDLGGNSFSSPPLFNISGAFVNEANSGNNVPVTAAKLVLSAGWGSTAAVTALQGSNAPVLFTITNSGTGQGATPTITYTFPVKYAVAPFSCTATDLGGTNPLLNPFTTSSLSVTGATFTATGTPTVSDTETMQITCVTP